MAVRGTDLRFCSQAARVGISGYTTSLSPHNHHHLTTSKSHHVIVKLRLTRLLKVSDHLKIPNSNNLPPPYPSPSSSQEHIQFNPSLLPNRLSQTPPTSSKPRASTLELHVRERTSPHEAPAPSAAASI
jgi:hypothetical protein